MDDAARIWQAIETANLAWTSGRPEDIAELYDDAVVMVAPELSQTVQGSEAMVRSYVEFLEVAEVDAFEVLTRRVDVAGNTAVATYLFRVRYALNGVSADERGQEVLVFRRTAEGRWLATWRTQVPLPPQASNAAPE